MSLPLISIVIPMYNVSPYIAETLQSVLNQTFTNFEVLLIDDESPDNSVEIVKQFQDPRIKVISQKNRGLAGARNTGIRNAQGQYIALIDGDDCWQNEKLAKHLKHLESNPKIGISFSRSEFMNEQSRPLGTYINSKLTKISIHDLFLTNPLGNGSSPVIRKAVLDDIAFLVNRANHNTEAKAEQWYFDETLRQAEDIECWARIAIKTAWKFEGLKEALTLYRVNTQGLSGNFMKQHEAFLTVLEKTKQYAPQLIQAHGSLYRASNARYLARLALRMQNPQMSLTLTKMALNYDWRILLRDPVKTTAIGLIAWIKSLGSVNSIRTSLS